MYKMMLFFPKIVVFSHVHPMKWKKKNTDKIDMPHIDESTWGMSVGRRGARRF